MPMGAAEIVASLKELCEAEGPQLTTAQIVDWIDEHDGFETDAELIAFAKKMKARQLARMLMYDDEETGRKVKRLWSFQGENGKRAYSDISTLAPHRRRELIQKYIQFVDQLSSVRRAMSDYFAGQQFFEFYVEEYEPEAAVSHS